LELVLQVPSMTHLRGNRHETKCRNTTRWRHEAIKIKQKTGTKIFLHSHRLRPAAKLDGRMTPTVLQCTRVHCFRFMFYFCLTVKWW